MRLSIILFCFLSLTSFGQTYSPKLTEIRDKLKNTKEEITLQGEFTSKQKTIIKEAHVAKIKWQLEILTPQNTITEGALYDYVHGILDRIKAANSDIPQEMELVIVKNIDYNAFTLGNDIFYMHLGLLMELKNEDEIAIVIGHEISHVTLQHAKDAIIASAKAQTDPELSAKIREARKQDYGNVSALNELLAPRLFEQKEESRKHEHSADSLGAVYIKNAGFNLQNCLFEFLVMEAHDENIGDDLDFSFLPPTVIQIFENYNSVYQRHGSLGPVKKNNKYEPFLRTHPYSKDRADKLIAEFRLNPVLPDESARFSPNFDAIKSELIEESFGAAFLYKDIIGAYLFATKYREYLKPQRFNNLMLHVFESLLFLKERHVAGKFIGIQDPQQAEDKDRLVHIFTKLTPDQCEMISDLFYNLLAPSQIETQEYAFYQLIKYTREGNFKNCEIVYNAWIDKIENDNYIHILNELDNYWRNVKLLKFVKPKK